MPLRARSRLVVLVAVAALVAAGCGGGGDRALADFEPGTSTLVDAGAEPGGVVAWDWAATTSTGLVLTTAVTQSISVGGAEESTAPLPTSVVGLRIEPRVTDDATELLVTAAEVLATSEGLGVTDPDLAEALGNQESAFDGLVGAAAVLGVTASGAITSYTPAMPDAELPVATLLERTITELGRLLVEWPAEPVGVGARWETTSLRVSQGITWEVETRWRLESAEAGLHTVSFTLTETAERQEVPAAEGREIRGTVSGEGTVVVDPRGARIVSGEVTTELSATVFDGDTVAATTSNRIGTLASPSVD